MGLKNAAANLAWFVFLLQSDLAYCGLPKNDAFDAQKELCNLGCACPLDGQSVMFLDCGRRDIVSLPPKIQFHPALSSITFQGNRISNISVDTFYNAATIQELDLSLNSITTISESSFAPFSELTTLRLAHNSLSVISDGVLKGLRNLRVLEIGHNALADLPQNLFSPTPELREVRLQHNKLKTLREDYFQFLPLLEKMDLEGNGLKTVPSQLFAPNRRLQWLSLADNCFERVPKEAFRQVPLLSSLDLSGNAFVKFQSGDFSTLINISLLYLNNLQRLVRIEKESFIHLRSLKMLSCSYNKKLSFIHPEAFGNNVSNPVRPYIQKLFLRNNALRSLPEPPSGVEPFTGLAYVDLRDNPWRCDCNIKWMTRLKWQFTSEVRCETPISLHGRSISSVDAADMVCNSHWVMSTIVLVISSIVALVVCVTTMLAVVCTRTPLGVYLRAKGQLSYVKLGRKSEVVDLEWDPTADM